MSLLVLGTVALDDVRTPSGFKKNMLGGSASHFSMAARLFIRVELVSVVGSDFPKEYIRLFNTKGISTVSLMKEPGKTFHWCGEYKGDLNTATTLNTELGVLPGFKPRITAFQKNIKNILKKKVVVLYP